MQTTAASPRSEMCVGSLTAVLSSGSPIRQVRQFLRLLFYSKPRIIVNPKVYPGALIYVEPAHEVVCTFSAEFYCNCHNCQSCPSSANHSSTANSSSSTASPSIKLLVEDPIVVNPGQTVSLVCITTGGEPPPILTWVSSNDSLPQRSVVKGGTLTLPAITSDEAGVYSCVASNNVGNPAKKSTTIVVRGKKA